MSKITIEFELPSRSGKVTFDDVSDATAFLDWVQTGNCVVWLESVADNGKIQAIKAVREIAPMSLVDAKNLVERAPCLVFRGTGAAAERAATVLRGAGAVARVEKSS